jgi:hypothetical protein
MRGNPGLTYEKPFGLRGLRAANCEHLERGRAYAVANYDRMGLVL